MLPSRPRVLVVDDSASNRYVFRRVLAGFDVEVVEAASGEAALERACEPGPLLLILLDIQLPGIDGFDVARRLRLFVATQDVPIIFATAEFTQADHRRAGYALGAVDYLITKPIDEELLRSRVQVFLDLLFKRRLLEAQVARVERENQQLFFENESFRVQQEDMLRQATQDPLTRLPNRLLFEDRLQSAIARASRARKHFALAFVDLDNLKQVNDLHGHAAGDELIVAVAGRLIESLRASDTVARLGGDEFAVLFEGLDEPAAALHLGRKLQEQISAPLLLQAGFDGRPLPLAPGASIGIALFPDHARTGDELMTLADLAMYQVKKGGGGVLVYQRRAPLRLAG